MGRAGIWWENRSLDFHAVVAGCVVASAGVVAGAAGAAGDGTGW
ncbi:hypothetical protein SAZ_03815 [Streptomyces noursei ZPM]|nr:hypothetical protein SAZ_03815 [Streptomyces noursei ZPM]EPY92799.1 hypothetical protein K530_51410 [Streptomyces noursei CCRC 11814]